MRTRPRAFPGHRPPILRPAALAPALLPRDAMVVVLLCMRSPLFPPWLFPFLFAALIVVPGAVLVMAFVALLRARARWIREEEEKE